jgi:paraquat-inducible protein B
MADEHTPHPALPESRTVPKQETRISLVWILPALAVVVALWVAIARIRSEGPAIKIVFRSATGLEAGKTKIYCRGVDLGTLSAIRLSKDHQRVIATAQMAPDTKDFLVKDTIFWVVGPRISGASISGLRTLISGAYIEMQIGSSKNERSDFVALEAPPVVSPDVPGRFFALKTSDLGSLDNGTPVFFRHLRVGQVASYELDDSGQTFTVRIFVRSPYDRYVTANTRFWQASGIDMELTANGLSVQTQSLISILIGGIGFETPSDARAIPAAAENTAFPLFGTRARAFVPSARNPETFVLIFKESVRGLAPGAPVDFRGVQIGEVAGVRGQVDVNTLEFRVSVVVHVDAERFGIRVLDLKPGADIAAMHRKLINALVARGLRAQLQTGNLLTGASFVALDYFPHAVPRTVDWSQTPVQLPTVRGRLETTEEGVTDIIKKLDQMPLKEIGTELRATLTSLSRTLVSTDQTMVAARGTLDNANNLVGPNSEQAEELSDALLQVSRAAQSLRVLADYLERHPEALVRGKPGEPN